MGGDDVIQGGAWQMKNSSELARWIAEDLLERTGNAMAAGHFDTFEECFAYPTVIESFTGQQSIESAQELKELFDALRAHYKTQGVTDIDRKCLSADTKGPDTIYTTHETRILRDTTLIQPPYPAFSIAKLIDDNWKIVFSSYAVCDAPVHDILLSGDFAFYHKCKMKQRR